MEAWLGPAILIVAVGIVLAWGRAPQSVRSWLPALGGLIVIFSVLLFATDVLRLLFGR